MHFSPPEKFCVRHRKHVNKYLLSPGHEDKLKTDRRRKSYARLEAVESMYDEWYIG